MTRTAEIFETLASNAKGQWLTASQVADLACETAKFADNALRDNVDKRCVRRISARAGAVQYRVLPKSKWTVKA